MQVNKINKSISLSKYDNFPVLVQSRLLRSMDGGQPSDAASYLPVPHLHAQVARRVAADVRAESRRLHENLARHRQNANGVTSVVLITVTSRVPITVTSRVPINVTSRIIGVISGVYINVMSRIINVTSGIYINVTSRIINVTSGVPITLTSRVPDETSVVPHGHLDVPVEVLFDSGVADLPDVVSVGECPVRGRRDHRVASLQRKVAQLLVEHSHRHQDVPHVEELVDGGLGAGLVHPVGHPAFGDGIGEDHSLLADLGDPGVVGHDVDHGAILEDSTVGVEDVGLVAGAVGGDHGVPRDVVDAHGTAWSDVHSHQMPQQDGRRTVGVDHWAGECHGHVSLQRVSVQIRAEVVRRFTFVRVEWTFGIMFFS